MTIHKSQGSQAARITVLLPDADSRLLTRELFYTAVTRAQPAARGRLRGRRTRGGGDPGAARDRPAAPAGGLSLTGRRNPRAISGR